MKELFDVNNAAARPMHTAFTASPDFTPHTALEPLQSRTERNPAGSALAARSARLDLDEADHIDDREMKDILYLASSAAQPRRSFFYPGAHPVVADDDDQ